MIVWHGIEGSTESTYMIALADKAFNAGFNVIRMNLRTCGGTEHLTKSIYHGGLTEDLREVVRQLIEDHHLERLFLVGFSLGGNMVPKPPANTRTTHQRKSWQSARFLRLLISRPVPT